MSSVQLKRGTASQWFTKNPILKNGELGVELDTKRMKLGNGTTRWNSLTYITVVPADLANTIGSYIPSEEKGTSGGVATLNSSGVIPDSQIPSTIARDTEIITSYNDLDDLPTLFSGSYNDLTNKPNSFDGSYTSLTEKPTLFSGSYEDLSNKPTIPNLSGYATELYVGTAISNLVDSAPGALNTLNELAAAINDDASYAATITTALGNKLDSSTASSTYAPIDSPTFTGSVGGVTKSHVGLGNVDNTSDENKPVSTATQTALNLKLDATARFININSQSTTYAILPSDLNKMIEMSGGGFIDLTDSESFEVGFSVDILQTTSSQVTVRGIGTTVINGTPGLKLRAQWSSGTLIKRATDLWVLIGDLST